MMDHQQTLTVLNKLADGIDPESGEVYSRDSPYQSPTVVRALYAAIQAMQKGPTRPKSHARAGAPWTDDEEARLLKAFATGKQPRDLIDDFDRSEVAITARLVKLGKMEAPASLRFIEAPKSASA